MKSEQVEHQRQNDKAQGDPLGHLGQLGVQSLGLALGQEGIGSAGNGTAEAGALAGLKQNDRDQENTGEKLKNGKNRGLRVHLIQPFLYYGKCVAFA